MPRRRRPSPPWSGRTVQDLPPWALVALAVLLWATILQPALRTGFRFDDQFLFELRTGLLEARGDTIGEVLGDVLGRMFEAGRLMPIAGFLGPTTAWVFSDAPFLYKAFLLALFVGALLACGSLLRSLGVRRGIAFCALTLAVCFVQLRRYHDPSLGYHGLVQLSLLLLAVSLLLFVRFLRGARWPAFAAALGLWLACLTTYEANAAFAVVFPCVALLVERRRRSWWWAAVPAGLGVAHALSVLLHHASSSTVIETYQPSRDVLAILETWGTMVLGAVPGSYAVLDPDGLMERWTSAELLGGAWRGLLAAVVLTAAAARLAGAPARHERKVLLALGVLLLALPGTTIALAPKYQAELEPGNAYLPVLVSVVGCALLAVAVVATCAGRVPRGLGRRSVLGVGAVVVGVAVAAGGAGNIRVVALEHETVASRGLLNDALRGGILQDLPAGSVVTAQARDLNWYPSNFGSDPIAFNAVVADRTGRHYDMRFVGGAAPTPLPGCVRRRWPRPSCGPVPGEGGWLVLRPLRRGGVAVLATTPRGRGADGAAPAVALHVFVRGGTSGQDPPVLTGTTGDGGAWSSAGTVRWSVPVAAAGGRRWLGRLVPGAAPPVASSVLVPGSQTNFVAPEGPGARVRAFGTRHLLP